mmetsp:Transcript_25475/g.73094  ORF Transcript_25475/g.73094 Transcript_25475/m.73094 type:complete len:238 (+) Transcript_25475:1194-1907(+)
MLSGASISRSAGGSASKFLCRCVFSTAFVALAKLLWSPRSCTVRCWRAASVSHTRGRLAGEGSAGPRAAPPLDEAAWASCDRESSPSSPRVRTASGQGADWPVGSAGRLPGLRSKRPPATAKLGSAGKSSETNDCAASNACLTRSAPSSSRSECLTARVQACSRRFSMTVASGKTMHCWPRSWMTWNCPLASDVSQLSSASGRSMPIAILRSTQSSRVRTNERSVMLTELRTSSASK